MSKRKKSGKTEPHSLDRRTCVLCGKTFPWPGGSGVVGTTGRFVCGLCLNASQTVLAGLNEKTNTESKEKLLTPQEIIHKLDGAIIGQTYAKKSIAVALWKQQLRATGDLTVPRANLLLYGPTGCGKTAIVREACKIVGLPFVSFDSTTLTETGYRGRDARDIITDLVNKFEDHPKLANGVVFLDEFDKLAAQGGDNRTAHARGTQHTLLKLIEGTDVECDYKTVSTEGMLFILGGAFTGLCSGRDPMQSCRPIGFLRPVAQKEELSAEIAVSDFVRYGIEPELMGRVGKYVRVDALTKEELKCILLESSLSAFRQYQEFFRGRGIRLEMGEKRINEIVNEAIARGTGARGLNTMVEEAVEPLLFKLAENKLTQKVNLQSEEHRYVS